MGNKVSAKSYAYGEHFPREEQPHQFQDESGAKEHALNSELDTLQHILNKLHMKSLPDGCVCLYRVNHKMELVEDPFSQKGAHHLKHHIHQILIIHTLHKRHHTAEITLSRRHQDVFREGQPISVPDGREKWSIGKINWIEDQLFTKTLLEHINLSQVDKTLD